LKIGKPDYLTSKCVLNLLIFLPRLTKLYCLVFVVTAKSWINFFLSDFDSYSVVPIYIRIICDPVQSFKLIFRLRDLQMDFKMKSIISKLLDLYIDQTGVECKVHYLKDSRTSTNSIRIAVWSPISLILDRYKVQTDCSVKSNIFNLGPLQSPDGLQCWIV